MTVEQTAVRRLVLACAMWGLSFPAAKALIMVQSSSAPGHDSWFYSATGMVARFSVAALLVAGFLLIKRRSLLPTREELHQGLGVAFFGGVGMLFQLDGLAHTEASTSAFLTQASVIFIPLTTALLTRRLPGRREVLSILIAVVGVAVLADFDPHAMRLARGEAETLISALFFTGHIMWLERPRYAQNKSVKVSLIMFAGIAVICFPVLLLQPQGVTQAVLSVSQWDAWWFIGMLIGPCTLLAFTWMNTWQRHVSATKAGLIYCLEPVFASVLALFLPAMFSRLAGLHYDNETLTRELVIGGGLVLLANILMQWKGSASRLNEHGI